jgi:glycosyltransferase involved in cell wall biosynthesis
VYKANKIALIIQSHELFPDFRSQKQIDILSELGMCINALVWNRSGSCRYIHEDHNVELSTIDLQVNHGLSAVSLMLNLPKFWYKAYQVICKIKPELIIANNLDAAIPAVLYKITNKCVVIHESREPYHKVFFMKTGWKFFEYFGWILDAFISHASTKVVTVTPNMVDMYRHMRITANYFPNAPKQEFINIDKTNNAIERDFLVFGFVGTIRPGVGIQKMAEAVSRHNSIPGNKKIKILLYGLVIDTYKTTLQEIEGKLRNFYEYGGALTPKDIPEIYKNIDVSFHLSENNEKFKNYALNVKIYESLAASTPVITNKIGENYDFIGEDSGVYWVDDESLNRIISSLVNSNGLFRNGEIGRNFIKDKEFIWELYAKDYKKMLLSLI